MLNDIMWSGLERDSVHLVFTLNCCLGLEHLV